MLIADLFRSIQRQISYSLANPIDQGKAIRIAILISVEIQSDHKLASMQVETINPSEHRLAGTDIWIVVPQGPYSEEMQTLEFWRNT